MTYILQAPDARLFCDLSAHSSTNPLFLLCPPSQSAIFSGGGICATCGKGRRAAGGRVAVYWPGPPVSGRRPAATAGGFAVILDREPRFRGLRMVGPGERRVMESREAE